MNIFSFNDFNLLEYNKYTGEEVADYIEEITPDDSDIPDYFIDTYIKPNDNWILTNIKLKDLLKDNTFRHYYKSGEVRYEDDEYSEDDLSQPLVIFKGNLLDGYSRASVMLRRGDKITRAFIHK